MRLIRTLLALGTFTMAGANLQAQQQLPRDSMDLARKYTTWFYTGMADSLLANMDSAFAAGKSIAEIEQAMAEVASRAGNEVEVLEEKFITRNGMRHYWRSAKMDIMPEPFLLRWVMDSRGKIAGVGMGPLSGAPPIDPPKN